ncbi:hypothetical protein EAS61_14275 [Bradyrhizobium zhanjiangense]|uniref:Uncharacterized protein n=1 Tax=Bradyrhizobium zhanjiangense TaxID=1325107 RepID=A0A4Q0QQL4_9BRAD|nr:hypothetical protein EAS61_14275 [Bradyrhizobium zhanjiangense]
MANASAAIVFVPARAAQVFSSERPCCWRRASLLAVGDGEVLVMGPQRAEADLRVVLTRGVGADA